LQRKMGQSCGAKKKKFSEKLHGMKDKTASKPTVHLQSKPKAKKGKNPERGESGTITYMGTGKNWWGGGGLGGVSSGRGVFPWTRESKTINEILGSRGEGGKTGVNWAQL